MLKTGDKAIDFTLNNDSGDLITLNKFIHKKVVLYFYPKDNTPGCSIEAEGFRDVYDDILDAGAVVIGISPDKQKSHKNFRKKFGLPFHLLSDPDHNIAEKYGAWGEKNMYGKKYTGIIRSTFVIDENQVISHVFPRVSPKVHAAEIIKALKE